MYDQIILTKLSLRKRLILMTCLFGCAMLSGCNKTVVPDQQPNNNQTVAQNNPATAQSPMQPQNPQQPSVPTQLPNAVPSVSPNTLPAGTSGTAPTGASPTPTPRSFSGAPSKVDPNDTFGIKPTPTPTPAPTPTIETVNGKVKQQWEAPAEYAAMKSPLKVTPEVIKEGKELYMMRCEQCHGAQGKGNGGYNRPEWGVSTNLASTVVQANTDGELFYKVTTNKGRHPASKIRFSDEERWAIVAFLRTFK